MEAILEIILQFLGEVVLQIVIECLSEAGLHMFAEASEKPPNAFVSVLLYTIFGTIAGALSLLILPHPFITNLALREANVLITPLIAGGAMMLVGRWRDKKGQERFGIDRFGYAFVFALSMALIRFNWAI
ncbi:hypothetical protein AB5I39_02315 [Sphingomonas sp. MMS24-J45]|uniref:hypothetical protein n=1 Tax=Sphingomonas sp. MMS24-J45 TaxID=3238806 RepID=UPI00384D9830